MTDTLTKTAKFWDKVAPKYAKDPISDMEAYNYTLERTQSYLKADDRVLELGCGTGSTALRLAPSVKELVGTDLSQSMIEIARQKAEVDTFANTDFRVLSAEDAAKLPGPFDVVLAHNLFHLVRDARSIMDDIHRMLPKGGYFIQKTPCLQDRSFGFKRFPVRAVIPIMQLFGKAPFVRWFTSRQLEQQVVDAAFEIVETGNIPAPSRYIVARRL